MDWVPLWTTVRSVSKSWTWLKWLSPYNFRNGQMKEIHKARYGRVCVCGASMTFSDTLPSQNLHKLTKEALQTPPLRDFMTFSLCNRCDWIHPWPLEISSVSSSYALPEDWEVRLRVLPFNQGLSILKSRDIILPTKVRLVKAMVFPVVMHGYESWTIKKAEC